MNENIFAADSPGFLRIKHRMKQTQSFHGLARFTFRSERRSRIDHNPAAERRKTSAQSLPRACRGDVSPGYAEKNGIESRRDGTRAEPRNDPAPRITNLRWATTAQALAFDPSHLSPWNERPPSCI
jgi:hypothetical protein